MLRLGAIVLAAGASTRMGRPKGALRWQGTTLLEHAVRQARASGQREKTSAVRSPNTLARMSGPG